MEVTFLQSYAIFPLYHNCFLRYAFIFCVLSLSLAVITFCRLQPRDSLRLWKSLILVSIRPSSRYVLLHWLYSSDVTLCVPSIIHLENGNKSHQGIHTLPYKALVAAFYPQLSHHSRVPRKDDFLGCFLPVCFPVNTASFILGETALSLWQKDWKHKSESVWFCPIFRKKKNIKGSQSSQKLLPGSLKKKQKTTKAWTSAVSSQINIINIIYIIII